jgi:uncharacterized pyridoxamine 5'-phosphate oxidase family protein
MGFQEYIKFANDNPICYVATTDGAQPRVRALLMLYANETGFYFTTFSPKEFSSQLKSNPKVELCFYNNPAELQNAKQMRVTGEAEFLHDKEALDKAYETRTFLEDITGKELRPIIEVFRIPSGEAHFWTLMDALKEQDLERIQF